MKRVAKFKVSMELIREALAMPEDTVILNIALDNRSLGIFTLVVEHPELDEVREGDAIPEITPIVTGDYDKRPSTWITFEWGK